MKKKEKIRERTTLGKEKELDARQARICFKTNLSEDHRLRSMWIDTRLTHKPEAILL